MAAKPTIIRNPPNDAEFRDAIDEMLAADVDDPVAAQEWLRQRYPRAVVRPRELAGERGVFWYVYREGRWTGGD